MVVKLNKKVGDIICHPSWLVYTVKEIVGIEQKQLKLFVVGQVSGIGKLPK
jgi:hypothetical protein